MNQDKQIRNSKREVDQTIRQTEDKTKNHQTVICRGHKNRIMKT